MAVSVKPKHLKRYTEIARLVFKYGRKGLDSGAPLDDLGLGEETEVTISSTCSKGNGAM